MRPKVCKQCGEKFIPERHMQACCSIPCAIDYGRKQKDKAERIAGIEDRKIIRTKLESLKTRSDYIKEAQIAVNAYVRYRDKDKPCISCGTSLGADGVGWGFDAGHFRSRGSASHLRFDERNIHGQCKRCNRYLGGNYSEYRTGLVVRLGKEEVEALEADNEPRKFSVEDLKHIKSTYIAKLKELKCRS